MGYVDLLPSEGRENQWLGYFFLVVSILAAAVSIAFLAVSIFAAEVSILAAAVSVAALAAESPLSVLEPSELQAVAKATIANANNTFFIMMFFSCLLMICGFIPELKKGNPCPGKKENLTSFGLQLPCIRINNSL
jgi:hypothetical protein